MTYNSAFVGCVIISGLKILICDIPISREISREILHVSFTSFVGVTVLSQKFRLYFLKHFNVWTSRTKKMQCEIPCISTRAFTFNPEGSHHVIFVMCLFDHI